ncbi:MAG: alpha/beta hydrolase [Candidatus Tyrphobacter sp.]
MIPALERLVALDDDERIPPECRTIVLRHEERSREAVLLFHGLTAAPAQFRRYARALFERGCNVLVPRLPLHGYADRLTPALADLTGDVLRTFSGRALDAARELGERVTVAGFSAGGTLTLSLAQSERFARAVAIAPFFGAAAVPRIAMDLAMALWLRLPNRFVWWDPIARERQGPAHGYPRYPTHALARLYELARSIARRAREPATADAVAVVLNCGEAAVSNAQLRALVARWRDAGVRVELIELRGMPPSHDIIEPERNRALSERVFPTILNAIHPRS